MPGNIGRGLRPTSIHGGNLLDFFDTFEQIRKDGSYSIASIEARDEKLVQSLVQAFGSKAAVTRLLRIWGISQMPSALQALSKYKKLDAFLLSFWLKKNGRSVSVTSLQPFVLRSVQPDIQNQFDRIVRQLPRMKLGAQLSYEARCRIVNMFFIMFAFSGTLQGFCGPLFLAEKDRQLDFRHVLDLWGLVLAGDLGSADLHSEKKSSMEFMRFAWDIVCEEVTDQVEHVYKQVLRKRRPGMKKPPLLKYHEYVTCSELENVVPTICMRVIFKTAFWQLVFWRKCRGGLLKHNECEAFSIMAERSYEKLLAETGHVRNQVHAPVALRQPDPNCVLFDKEAFLKMLTDAGVADFHTYYQSHVLKRAIQLPLLMCSKRSALDDADKRVSPGRPRKRLKSVKYQDGTVCNAETNIDPQRGANMEDTEDGRSSDELQTRLKSAKAQDGMVCQAQTNIGSHREVRDEVDEEVSSERPQTRLKSAEVQKGTVCHLETNNGSQLRVQATDVESPVPLVPTLPEFETADCAQQTHAESGWKQFVQIFVRSVQNFFGAGRNERNA